MRKVADMRKTISALKARQNLGELLEEVYYRGGQYIIERAGKPMAAVVPLAQLEAWQARRDAFFGMVDEARDKNRRTKPVTIEKEVADTVQAVRTRRPRQRV